MKIHWNLAALTVVVAGALAWVAACGLSEGMTYYKTIAELRQMGGSAFERRLRVAGNVEPGSIVRTGREVRFVLRQDQLTLRVIYNGTDPLPDTFRDGSEALADGKLGQDWVFRATKIQAKCASKYQTQPARKPAARLNRAGI